MHVKVERRTLFWPRTLAGVGVSTIAIPGIAGRGTATFAAADSGASYDGDTIASLVNTPENAAMRLDLPSDVIAIGIAPDSIIHSCDIALGGNFDEQNRHGVSPGSPLIGCVGFSHAMVTLRSPIPLIPKTSTFIFDSNANETTPDPTTAGLTCAAWPLRLELFRACEVPPQRSHKRAPMSSLSLMTATVGNTRRFATCVDGRRGVDFEIAVPASSAGSAVFSLFAFAPSRANANIDDGSIEIPIPLDDLGTLTETVAPGAGSLLSFRGNPFPGSVLVATLEASGGTMAVQLRVRGWD